ncbi:MAG: asparagine synthase-related protein [Bacteroidetes bacterium]|nr:asparagine synthase-related protein [Bacteroidota bacterium]
MINPIIPIRQKFYKSHENVLLSNWEKEASAALDLKAICAFCALGFFLDDDTYYKNIKVVKPSTTLVLEGDKIVSSNTNFKWHYNPREITFNETVNEFAELFEKIIAEQTKDKYVILPLSGGLDSRTQAVALRNNPEKVFAYSYQFKNGVNENKYGEAIANALHFKFKKLEIEKGYLWKVIDDLASINHCFSDFTSPRQMAFLDEYPPMGDVFSLGHWGDVLFDSMGLNEEADFETQLRVLLKKIVKKGGMELGQSLWQAWGLAGDFQSYLTERVSVLLDNIKISNANARIRVFKSMYWATRWTSVNLSVFEHARPITLPYYDDRMCKFICTIPEAHLAARKIQIEYIKRHSPEVAKIAWQAQHPYHLFNYHHNKMLYNLGYRVADKLKREMNKIVGKEMIERNWELQFLGKANEPMLMHTLFDNQKLNAAIPLALTTSFYEKFKNANHVYYSHSINMLLVLSKLF